MEILVDALGSFFDWGPLGLMGRRWVKRYEAGERVFVRGTASGLTGSPRWATYLVADAKRLSVANEKRDDTVLFPLPTPSPESTVEECLGSLKGKTFHYRYRSAKGFIEVYPGAPAAGYVVKRALEDMHLTRQTGK